MLHCGSFCNLIVGEPYLLSLVHLGPWSTWDRAAPHGGSKTFPIFSPPSILIVVPRYAVWHTQDWAKEKTRIQNNENVTKSVGRQSIYRKNIICHSHQVPSIPGHANCWQVNSKCCGNILYSGLKSGIFHSLMIVGPVRKPTHFESFN